MALQLLKELGHEHGVLPAGDADGDAIIRLHELIGLDGLCKAAEEVPVEAPVLDQGLFNLLVPVLRRVAFLQPGPVAPGQGPGPVALFAQDLRHPQALRPVHAKKNVLRIVRKDPVRHLLQQVRNLNGSGYGPVLVGNVVSHIDKGPKTFRQIRQVFYADFYIFQNNSTCKLSNDVVAERNPAGSACRIPISLAIIDLVPS